MTGFSANELDWLLAETRSALGPARTGDGAPGSANESAVEGTGESADALVRAAVTAGRLERLEFGPRAMRMASQELGEHVVTAVNAAFDDLHAKSAGGGAVADAERLSEQVRQVQELGLRQMELMRQSITDLMARMYGGGR